MPDTWVEDRWNTHKRKLADIQHDKDLKQKARACLDSMFNDLAVRVATDIETFNETFANSNESAPLKLFKPDGSSIQITRSGELLTTAKKEGGIIKIEHGSSRVPSETMSDRIEVVPDPADDIRYSHKGGILPDVSDASAIVLSKVFPA